jgi:aspartate ammonia-lyase
MRVTMAITPLFGHGVAQTNEMRREKDSLGTVDVPKDAYVGAQSVRAWENFPGHQGMTPPGAYPVWIRAMGLIKQATTQANQSLGLLAPGDSARNALVGKAIDKAAAEMARSDRFNDQFKLNVVQGGAGTSLHMHVNEILANRASELIGGRKGEYPINPNDDVNYGQSTNDVIPMSMRLTILLMQKQLQESAGHLETAFRKKAQENKEVVIAGRTHLQDAVPITLGQVFNAWADAVKSATEHLTQVSHGLEQVSLGATAVGTGLNSHPDYRQKVTENLSRLTGIPFKPEANYFLATNSMAGVVRYSSALKDMAIELDKICNDLRLYGSSPHTAIGELKLPELQPGSSIMPGKVNPVIPEMVNQISYAVQGNDLTIDLCARNGQLQLNVMGPMALYKVTDSIRMLTNGMTALADKCVDGIQPNTPLIKERLDHGTTLVTALNPYIGYSKAAEISKTMKSTGKTIWNVLDSMTLTDKEGKPLPLDQILSPVALTQPRPIVHKT